MKYHNKRDSLIVIGTARQVSFKRKYLDACRSYLARTCFSNDFEMAVR